MSRLMQLANAFLVLLLFYNPAFALTIDESKHLLLRAGFAAQPDLMSTLISLDKPRAVDYLLNLNPKTMIVPECVHKKLPPGKERKALSKEARKALQKTQRECIKLLKSAYLEYLVQDRAVLTSQMTLFWHNLFTSAFRKVKHVNLIFAQHQTLQTHALGNFDQLLNAIVKDPAMLIYLDNVSNTKQRPNENLARELLELFTLGEGNYTEQDVVSAAKALTGLGVDRNNYQQNFRAKRHDNSVKEIFGGVKIKDSKQLITAILSNVQSSRYITEKIWLHFISKVNDEQQAELAKRFAKDWNIKKLVKHILLSEAFWQDQGQMVKSPVELVVGSGKMFGDVKITSKRMQRMARQMGQNVFDPPNVKGWPSGSAWVDANKLIIRQQYSNQLIRALRSDMRALSEKVCSSAFLESLSTFELPSIKSMSSMNNDTCVQQLTQIISDPKWQLK
jgi:uncharacterized protein (DUF1800 family)